MTKFDAFLVWTILNVASTVTIQRRNASTLLPSVFISGDPKSSQKPFHLLSNLLRKE